VPRFRPWRQAAETAGRGVRDGANALRMDPEHLDGLLPHRLAGSDDHGGQSQSHQQRRALADPGRLSVPRRIHPRGKVVQRQDAWAASQIGHREVRSVEQSGLQAAQFAVQAHSHQRRSAGLRGPPPRRRLTGAV